MRWVVGLERRVFIINASLLPVHKFSALLGNLVDVTFSPSIPFRWVGERPRFSHYPASVEAFIVSGVGGTFITTGKPIEHTVVLNFSVPCVVYADV